MRIKSEIWVRAYLRRCQGHGAPAFVARRGDEHAGAIYICINRLDGTVKLYGPAPAGLETSDVERRWVSCFAAPLVSEGEAVSYLARQTKFDPDIWIVEVEDKAGRHFLGEDTAED
ncbi:MAG: DUF1491 family protein [Methyloceanibacter sp.]|jgi:hypothetical protein